MSANPVTVAWISNFPVEWLEGIPELLARLPREHPGTWQMVLLSEFEKQPELLVHVIVLRKNVPHDISFVRNHVTFHVLKVPGHVRAPSLFWVDTVRIRGALRRIRPDLVHAWGSEQGAALIATRLGRPFLVTIQGLFRWYKEVVPLRGYERIAAWMERLSLPRARAVTTESAFAVRYLRRFYPAMQIHQVEHAPNWLYHRVQRQPQLEPIRFLSLGSLTYRKGSDLMLRGLAQCAGRFPFEAVVIGAPNEALLAGLRQELPAEFWRRVTFKHDVFPAEIAREMATATLLILPTRADTSPNAVKEAVVAGLPVVATAVGGIPDYVAPGENGVLFPSGDLEGCVGAIAEACAHPLFSRGLVDAQRLAQVRDYLSPARMAEGFLRIYQELARTGR
jgi:glycosyltransferase involved in cell wall biosynthesis